MELKSIKDRAPLLGLALWLLALGIVEVLLLGWEASKVHIAITVVSGIVSYAAASLMVRLSN